MNLTELQKKLIAAARLNRPSDAVPFAFEKRVMARLLSPVEMDVWAQWGRVLWRAAAPCVAIMLLVSVWALILTRPNRSSDTASADIEGTMLASFDNFGEAP